MSADLRVIDGLEVSQWDRELFEQFPAGNVMCAHVTVAIWEDARGALSSLGNWNRRFRENADLIELARTVDDIQRIADSGRTAIVLGFQNAAPFEDDFDLIELFHTLGVRISQLTYNIQTNVASSCYEPRDGGLSRFGKSVIREMNRCGMIIDLSHVGPRSSLEAIEISERPVAITHANPATHYPAVRNVSNELMLELARAGGVMGCTPHPGLTGGKPVELNEWCQMVADVAELIGVDHVAIGSDMAQHWTHGGITWAVRGRWWSQEEPDYAPPEDPWDPDPSVRDERMEFEWPEFFRSPADFPRIPPGLRDVGFSDDEITRILHGNWLRLFADGFVPSQ